MQFGAVTDKEGDENGGAGGQEDEAEERGAAEGGVTVRPGLAGGGRQPSRAQHGESRHQLAPARALAPGAPCSRGRDLYEFRTSVSPLKQSPLQGEETGWQTFIGCPELFSLNSREFRGFRVVLINVIHKNWLIHVFVASLYIVIQQL